MTNRAEELIADLEAEIAQRDARIEALEVDIVYLKSAEKERNALRDELAALKAQQPRAGVALSDLIAELKTQADEIAREGHAGWGNTMRSAADALSVAGVVMPERKSLDDEWHSLMKYRAVGWNACLDEVARLNSYPVSAGEYEAVQVIGYRVSMPGEPELGTWLDEEAEDEPQIQRHEPLMAVAQHEKIVASLKPCADGITAQDERAMFDVYICAEQGWSDGIDTTHIGATFAPWRAWQARARLNPCRAQAVLDLGQAATDVLAERKRQITEEGWTPEHDDHHTYGEIADAAACYALWGGGSSPHNFDQFWPWDRSWLKFGQARQMLIKSGALILAEIERLDRAAAQQKESGDEQI